jgi:hypothetical protein
MKAILFATEKQAEAYIRDNYPGMDTEKSSLSDRSDWEGSDRVMENFSWSGETECENILDEEGNTIARVAWWESGDDTYEIWYGEECVARVNDHPHAQAIFEDYVDREVNYEKFKDEEEGDSYAVCLICNGQVIDEYSMS